KVWDLSTRRVLHTFPKQANGVMDVVFDREGKRLASVGMDGKVRVWDWPSRKVVLEKQFWTHGIYQVAFGPSGRLAVVGEMQFSIIVWDLVAQREVRRLAGHRDRTTWVAFHANGSRLASLCPLEGTAKFWDVGTGKEIRTLHGISCMRAAFSPDGKQFAA